MTHAMLKGSNIQLQAAAVRAVLRWTPGTDVHYVDASALLLGTDGRVRSDEDFVFYNQPRHPSGLVRYLPKRNEPEGLTDTVEVDLAGLDPSVERVMLSASADGGTFADVRDLVLLVVDAGSGETVAHFEIHPETGSETALICGELYRRGDGWKFRALGQGYDTGLTGLATDFGVTVEDAPDTEGGPAQTIPQPPPEPDFPDPDPAPEPRPEPEPHPEPPPGPTPPPPRPVPGPTPGPEPLPEPEPQPSPEPAAASAPVPASHPTAPVPAQPAAGPPAFPPAPPVPPGEPPAGGYPQPPAHTPPRPAYGYPHGTVPPPPPVRPPAAPPAQPDPAFTLPPQGPQFLGR
ncbi:TerD family protein [Streptomyces sp. TRM43335]|uniref:TerD family protein n=1 Tax=Streptomyces taklimakanensis TaxID=2569853 RepID=A0A6G2B9G7_9ACTN|nr:TerD family protein [Streptomyces taklimakanensis]MTE18874.1 TerD family protein [Streptomyces taklimakanensis]